MWSILNRRLATSSARLDSEIHNWMGVSRAFRGRQREGTVILVDNKNELYQFLLELVNGEKERCVDLLQVDDVMKARVVIEEFGDKRIKAVVITADMLDLPCNGSSLPGWLSKNYHQIPVWIVNAKKEEVEEYQHVGMAVGVLSDSSSPSILVHSLGLRIV